jgi:hypothetical protein
VTIIAIDFEYNRSRGNPITEIRVSTFSTYEWRQFTSTQKSKIQPRCYVTSKSSPGRCLFGESEHMPKKNILQLLQDTISMKSPTGTPSKVVLVGHHISSELDIMEKVGINLRDQELYSIEGILDIFTIIRHLGEPFSHRTSLGNMLEFLGIPFQKSCLHNAGNDAHFILRAFLMLAATSLKRLELEHSLTTQISDLKSIALDPIDFDSPTPDFKKYCMEVDVKKVESALRTLELERAMELDFWGGSEEESLGTTLFGMDSDI